MYARFDAQMFKGLSISPMAQAKLSAAPFTGEVLQVSIFWRLRSDFDGGRCVEERTLHRITCEGTQL